MKRILLAGAAATALLAAPAAAIAAQSQDQPPAPAKTEDITFIKHLTDANTLTFSGTTAGAVRGQLIDPATYTFTGDIVLLIR